MSRFNTSVVCFWWAAELFFCFVFQQGSQLSQTRYIFLSAFVFMQFTTSSITFEEPTLYDKGTFQNCCVSCLVFSLIKSFLKCLPKTLMAADRRLFSGFSLHAIIIFCQVLWCHLVIFKLVLNCIKQEMASLDSFHVMRQNHLEAKSAKEAQAAGFPADSVESSQHLPEMKAFNTCLSGIRLLTWNKKKPSPKG